MQARRGGCALLSAELRGRVLGCPGRRLGGGLLVVPFLVEWWDWG